MTTLAIIFWTLTGIVFLATLILLLLYILDLIDSRVAEIGFIIVTILGLISTVVMICTNPKSRVEEYSLKEWRMDYRITTMNEKSDTTLVLTKIR